MRALAAAWRRWTEPSPLLEDPEERRRARLLLSILLPLTAVAALSTLTTPLLVSSNGRVSVTPANTVGVLATLVLGLAYGLSRSRHYEHGAVVAVGIAAVGTWQAYFANQALPGSDVILAFLAVSLVLSSLLLPPMFTVALTALHAVGLAAFATLYDPTRRDVAVNLAIFVVMVGVLVVVHDAVRRRDAALRKQAEDALRESEGRFRLAFEAAAVGRAITTPQGRWLKVNDALCSIVGYSREEMLSPGFNDLTLAEDRPALEAARKGVLSGETPSWDVETRFRHKQGHVIWVRTVVSVVRDADGRPLYLVGDVQDVTARRQVEEARMLALERLSEISRLKEVNAFKTQLLNTASHELNTPISALKLQLFVLKKHKVSEDAHARALAVLDRNVDRLALLVKDVLDVARLESGQMKLRRARLPLAPLLKEAMEPYETAARDAGVTLHLEAAPVEVEADPQRLTQVVHNLLSNALKFTPRGGEVVVEAKPDDEATLVKVRDSGAGLTADQMARLFQPFSQVHDTMQQTRAGTGLGLHICKGIVEEHGGRIWVESEGPGKGSTFGFALPRLGGQGSSTPA